MSSRITSLEERIERLEALHREWYCTFHECGGTAAGYETCAVGRETNDTENCRCERRLLHDE